MSTISAANVQQLRQRTGAGLMDCKSALSETAGDLDKAMEVLRKKGIMKASKKADRVANQGSVYSYIHGGGRIGVLVEINCETDFVARNEKFQELCREISMQVAAANPRYVSREDVPEASLAKEREVYAAQLQGSGKPEAIVQKIVDGKVEKYFEEVCLLEQPYIKDSGVKVGDFLKTIIATIGENIVVRRFTRYELGQADS